jgi:hypothetical protein
VTRLGSDIRVLDTQSRQARHLTPHFPDIVAHLSAWFSPGTPVVDDELIIWDEDTARTSFLAVAAGRRLAVVVAGQTASLACIDLLEVPLARTFALTEAALPWELLRTGHPGDKLALLPRRRPGTCDRRCG